MGTIKNLDGQLKGAKSKNKRLSRKLNKISNLAKEKQRAAAAAAEEGSGGNKQAESMRDLLEELRRSNEDVVALSSVATSAGEESDGESSVDPEDRVPRDDDLVSVIYPENEGDDILSQHLDRKEERDRQQKRRSRSRSSSKSKSK